jgi:glycosyltransferase involved in cell wall biosynthesis
LVQRAVNLFGFVALVERNMSLIRARKIEIVHLNNSIVRSHDWKLAALLTRTPCVTHERGINTFYPWVAKFLGRRQKAVISMSKSIADYMALGGVDMHNVLVLYDGVDPKALRLTRTPEAVRQELQIGPHDPVVGIVGNVRHWKGQEVVIRALPALVKTHPTLVCLIVGKAGVADRAYEETLHGLVREFGIEKNVRFLGYQKHPADSVNIMDVVIHASVQPEPFGMVVLEAMALAKPVVGSRAGGVPEMVVEGVTGYPFPPGNSDELAARVGELLADPVRARAMGQAGHARVVSDFNVATYVRDVETLYDHIIAGKPLPPLGPAAAAGSPAHAQ